MILKKPWISHEAVQQTRNDFLLSLYAQASDQLFCLTISTIKAMIPAIAEKMTMPTTE
jgi:hypothetical protein